MSSPRERVFLQQVWNPDYLGSDRTPDQDQYLYTVNTVENTLRVSIGQKLTKREVEELIDDDIVVKIR